MTSISTLKDQVLRLIEKRNKRLEKEGVRDNGKIEKSKKES